MATGISPSSSVLMPLEPFHDVYFLKVTRYPWDRAAIKAFAGPWVPTGPFIPPHAHVRLAPGVLLGTDTLGKFIVSACVPTCLRLLPGLSDWLRAHRVREQ